MTTETIFSCPVCDHNTDVRYGTGGWAEWEVCPHCGFAYEWSQDDGDEFGYEVLKAHMEHFMRIPKYKDDIRLSTYRKALSTYSHEERKVISYDPASFESSIAKSRATYSEHAEWSGYMAYQKEGVLTEGVLSCALLGDILKVSMTQECEEGLVQHWYFNDTEIACGPHGDFFEIVPKEAGILMYELVEEKLQSMLTQSSNGLIKVHQDLVDEAWLNKWLDAEEGVLQPWHHIRKWDSQRHVTFLEHYHHRGFFNYTVLHLDKTNGASLHFTRVDELNSTSSFNQFGKEDAMEMCTIMPNRNEILCAYSSEWDRRFQDSADFINNMIGFTFPDDIPTYLLNLVEQQGFSQKEVERFMNSTLAIQPVLRPFKIVSSFHFYSDGPNEVLEELERYEKDSL